LDRLTDDEPDKPVESRAKRVVSTARLRESVRRDLAWLLNTTNLASVRDLSAVPEVAESTLNYGVPDLAGRTKSTVKAEEIERVIRHAIWRYEPRLVRRSVHVKMVGEPSDIKFNNMCFVIEAELWAQPIPIRLFLRTELDLESGDARVIELSGTAG
jgi:type VI secretion system protein ImpF